MKVILQQEVKSLGKRGDILEVSEGHARNFLFPRKLAVEATTGNLKTLEVRKQKEELKKAEDKKQAQALGEKIKRLKVEIKAKTGDNGRLFGSITSKDIADAVKAASGIDLDKRKIELEEPIKCLGSYSLKIKLHKDVVSEFQVNVVEV